MIRTNRGVLDGEKNVIEDFIAWYFRNISSYHEYASRIRDTCAILLQHEDVKCRVSENAENPTRLLAVLKARQQARERPYRSVDEIRHDMPDLIGVRIRLGSSANKGSVNQKIGEFLRVESCAEGAQDEDEEINEGYSITRHLVTLDEKTIPWDKAWKKKMIEIQVESPLPGELCNSWSLDEDNKKFICPWQLGEFLWQWKEKRGMEGEKLQDVLSLWELERIFGMEESQVQEDILRELSFPPRPGTQMNRLMKEFAPFRLDIVTYMMHQIIWTQVGKEGCDEKELMMRQGSREQVQRNQLKVIIRAVLWLDHLYNMSDWYDIMNTENPQLPGNTRNYEQLVSRMHWLSRWSGEKCNEIEGNAPFSQNDTVILENLWSCFVNHKRKPIQFAFRLAVLGVNRESRADWKVLLTRALSGNEKESHQLFMDIRRLKERS